MEESDILINFFNNLFYYLTNQQYDFDNNNVFRTHNNKLNTNGDFSFSLNINAWRKHIQDSKNIKIVNYINNFTNEVHNEIIEDIISQSRNNFITISNCSIEKEKINIFLNRPETFKNIITSILHLKENYGSTKLLYKSKVNIITDIDDSILLSNQLDLTQLRIKLLKDLINNLLQITKNQCAEKEEIIILTNKSKCTSNEKKIVCGVVIGNKFGKKNAEITAEEYYNKRKVDMRLIAQHKYGLRVNSEKGWSDFFEKLGTAAVTVDLLHVKPCRPIVINIENATSTHSRGASFILYNCARLAKIFKHFDEKVTNGIYPPLKDINEVDFNLLNQPEEWELLYVYLLQYPQIVRNCIKDISDCKINVHYICTFLDSLCSLFSVYYRRIRILTDPRDHLFPILQARIYLLKGVQQVLHNALKLLNISPVTQM